MEVSVARMSFSLINPRLSLVTRVNTR